MGVQNKYSAQQDKKKIVTEIKMAFYIYEQPAFTTMDRYHPGFYQPFRSTSRPRCWNLLENLLEREGMSNYSSQSCCSSKSMNKSVEKSSDSILDEGKLEVQANKTSEENKLIEPVKETISKKFMSKVSCQENMEKVEIKIQLQGHKFKAEHLDVQVVNGDVLIVKAEDEEEKFERKFKLPSNTLAEKIDSKFDIKEENTQTLLINIPKNVKITQVPIAMDE